MAHGFQGIGKLPESKNSFKALQDWAWDKLKNAAKTAGSKKKSTGLVLNQDKSIFPVDIIDVDATEVKEAAQIAGQSSMFGLPSKKGGDIVSNPLTGGNSLTQPRTDSNVQAASAILDFKINNDGIYSAASMQEYDSNDPSALLQKIVVNTEALVRVVGEHKEAMVHQALRKEKHDDIMAARTRAWMEQKAFGGGNSGGGGSDIADIAGLGLDLAMGGKGGGKGEKTLAAINALTGGLGSKAGKSISGLGKTGKAGSVMKHGIGRAAKRGAIKTGIAGLKGGTKIAAKATPFLGAGLGLLFGLGRMMKGDFIAGALEMTSGLLSMTGAGIPAAIAIDSALVAKDMADSAGSADTGGIIDKQIHTGGLDGKGGSLTMTHPGELIANTNQLKEIPNYFLDTLSEREPDFSKAIGLGLYWNQKKYSMFWEGKGGGGGDDKEKLPPVAIQMLSQIGRSLIGSKVDDGKYGPGFLRLFNENTERGRQLRAEDEVIHGSGPGATLRAITGSKLGDGYIGPKWLNWKSKNQPTVDPQQVLRYLQSQGVDQQDAVTWTNKINSASGFAGDAKGGLYGWEGNDFSAMKSAVGKDWQTDWRGQLDYLIKDQVILTQDKTLAGKTDGTPPATSSSSNANDTANTLNQLSSSQAMVQAGNAPVIVNMQSPGVGGGSPGTTPSGYLNGITMADTGTEVFNNLRIRSIR